MRGADVWSAERYEAMMEEVLFVEWPIGTWAKVHFIRESGLSLKGICKWELRGLG